MYIPVHEDCIGNSKVCIHVSKECISNRKESDQCKLKKKLKKVMKLKQEEFEQGRVLEYGKDAQTPFAAASLGSNEMCLGNENSASASNKFLKYIEVVVRQQTRTNK